MHAWEQIQLTVDYIEGHLGENMEIDELAKIANLSPFYYQRLFKRLVKKPVKEYIKLRRMAKACDLLLEEEQRILDVSLALGFTSHEQFTRTFKETFQMTPKEYRLHPVALNRMTKPALLLNYVLVDEDVPLITEGIVLEIGRKKLASAEHFAGFTQTLPSQFVEGLGTESGEDPLDTLWQKLHKEKHKLPALIDDTEIGVAFPSDKEGYFNYFAGAKVKEILQRDSYQSWELTEGEYVVCYFEAENFEDLVMNVLYKAQSYLFGVWLPKHQLTTEPYCVEYYTQHVEETSAMEIWVRLIGSKGEDANA